MLSKLSESSRRITRVSTYVFGILFLCMLLASVAFAGAITWVTSDGSGDSHNVAMDSSGSALAYQTSTKNAQGLITNVRVVAFTGGQKTQVSSGFDWAGFPYVNQNFDGLGTWVGFYGDKFFATTGAYKFQFGYASVTEIPGYPLTKFVPAIKDGGTIVAYRMYNDGNAGDLFIGLSNSKGTATAGPVCSADGNRVAVRNGTTVLIFNNGTQTYSATAAGSNTEAPALSANGSYIAYQTSSTQVSSFNLDSNNARIDYAGSAPVALSADGTLLACKNGTGITLYNTADGTTVGSYANVNPTELALAKTLTGTKLAFVTTDNLAGDTGSYSDVFTWSNTAPVASDVTKTTDEETQVPITLSGTDADSDPLTYAIVSGPDAAKGTLGTLAGNTVTFTPAANFVGDATFTYKVSDDAGFTSAPATVTITVSQVNDMPTFAEGADVMVNEDLPAYDVQWATDVWAGAKGDTYENGQTLTMNATLNSGATLFAAAPKFVVNADHTANLQFTLNANVSGFALMSVTLSDGDKTTTLVIAKITVNETNDAPSFTMGADQVVGEDCGAESVVGWAKDISAGTNEATQTVAFTVTNDNNALFLVQPMIDATGTLTYAVKTNANGVATVTVVLKDSYDPPAETAAQTFTITVNAQNDAPTADAVSVETNEDAPITITLDGSDIDSAGLTYSIVSGPSADAGTLGTISGDQVTFTPTANFNGAATFTYKANDGEFDSSAATVTITVTAQNDVPVLSPISAKSTYRNVALADIPLTVTDVDDLSAVQMSWAPKDASGIVQDVAFTGTARMTITPALDMVGTTTITITATDGAGAQSSQDVTITVKQTYTVTPSAEAGGTISPDTASVVLPNGYAFFTATPDKANNYGVDAWYINDVQAQIGGLTYDLSAINTDTRVKVTFKQDFPAPTVDTVTGFTNPQENVGQAAITISGSGFRSGASVYLANGDPALTITAADVVVSPDGTQLTCNINLTRNATGSWALVVTNDDNKSAGKDNAVLLVNAAPHLRSVTPATGQTGQPVSVEVIGYGFDPNATVQLQRSGKPAVSFATTFFDKTRLLGTVTLPATDASTTADVWNVVVVNGDNAISTEPMSFTVGPNPAPTITAVSPVSVRKLANGTGTANLTITGTGFSANAAVLLHPDGVISTGSDVTLPMPTTATATQLDWTGVDITSIAPGQWDVIVTNADGQSATLKDGLTVLPAGLTAVALSVNRPDPQPYGCTLTLTAAKTGSAQNVEYAFYAKRLNSITQQWIVTQLRGYGAATFDWKPDMPANYYLYATAREVGSGVEYQVISSELFYRIQDGSIASVTFSYTRNANGTYRLKGSVTGTAVNVEYRFVGYLKDPVTGKLTSQNIRGYGMANEYDWTPSSSGTYLLGVLARVVGSTSSYDKQSSIMPYQITK